MNAVEAGEAASFELRAGHWNVSLAIARNIAGPFAQVTFVIRM